VSPLLYDQLADPILAEAAGNMLFSESVVISKMFVDAESMAGSRTAAVVGTELPFAQMYYPVRDPSLTRIIGAVGAAIRIDRILQSVVSPKSVLLDVVIENNCGQVATYKVSPGGPDGSNLRYVGKGNHHDSKYDNMVLSTTFAEYKKSLDLISTGGITAATEFADDGYCNYRFLVYPTKALQEQYTSHDPYVYAAMVVVICLFTSLVFVLYDVLVRRRQKKVMASAKRTNDIVSSLFPSNVRCRLFNDDSATRAQPPGSIFAGPEGAIINENGDSSKHGPSSVYGTAPIADLFPSATIFFLDIAGFTAWSSEREATQVRSLKSTFFRHALPLSLTPLII
jgi:hypothetical protein